MNILVTGANGMLGEECTRLLAESHQIHTCDLHNALLSDLDVPYTQLDITHADRVKALVKAEKPDVIVNCAAYTSVDGSERQRELAWAINVEGVKNLVGVLNATGGSIIHISTDYVFDGLNGPYREDDETNPINYYGETKLASEKVLKEALVPWTVIRTNVLFGNSQQKQASFVNWVVEKAKRRESISVVNDQFGNPTWTYGLAQAIETIIANGAHGMYHYAGADYINRMEFALEVASVFALDPTLIRATTTRALAQTAKRPFKGGLKCELIRNKLNVKFYTIKEALNAMKGSANWNQ